MAEAVTSDVAASVPAATGPLGRAIHRAALWLAYAGGAMLVAIALLTVVSVTGRRFFGSPVPGDYELVAMGTAIAVFAFLPLCQVRGGNVIVDIFTLKASRRVRAVLDGLGVVIYTGIAALLLWRMYDGMWDRIPDPEAFRYGETTMVLQIPVWPAFVPILVSLLVLVLACAHGAVARLRDGAGR